MKRPSSNIKENYSASIAISLRNDGYSPYMQQSGGKVSTAKISFHDRSDEISLSDGDNTLLRVTSPSLKQLIKDEAMPSTHELFKAPSSIALQTKTKEFLTINDDVPKKMPKPSRNQNRIHK